MNRSALVKYQRQTERGKETGTECRYLDDGAALDSKDIKLERPELGVTGATEIGGGRRHPIGPT